MALPNGIVKLEELAAYYTDHADWGTFKADCWAPNPRDPCNPRLILFRWVQSQSFLPWNPEKF